MIMSITSSTQINQREMIDNDEEIAHRLAHTIIVLLIPEHSKERDVLHTHIIRVGNGQNFENSLNTGTIYLWIEKYMVALY